MKKSELLYKTLSGFLDDMIKETLDRRENAKQGYGPHYSTSKKLELHYMAGRLHSLTQVQSALQILYKKLNSFNKPEPLLKIVSPPEPEPPKGA